MRKGRRMKVDYHLLARDFIRLLRGTLTQRELSSRLGYSFNQVGKWESGITQIKWENFVDLTFALKIPLESHLSYFLSYPLGSFKIKDIMKILSQSYFIEEFEDGYLAKLIERKVRTSTALDLSEFFEVVDTRPSMLLAWVSYYVDCAKIELLKCNYEQYMLELDAVFKDPNCIFVDAALQVQEYVELTEHDENVLLSHCSCTPRALRDALHLLKEKNLIFFNGKKYKTGMQNFSFSFSKSSRLRSFHQYAAKKVFEELGAEPGPESKTASTSSSMVSTRVVPISKLAAEKISLLVSKFHSEVGEVIKNDNLEKNNVQIITVHHLPIGPVPK